MKDLQISIKGEITDSNFEEWKRSLIQRIEATNTELANDEDFASADQTVKSYKAIEKRLDEVKQSALEQSRDIMSLFDAIDSVKSHVRNTRLILNRQLIQRKKEIRLELIDSAIKRVRDVINSKEGVFPLLNHSDILQELDFELAIKGKSSLKIAQSALDKLVKAKFKEIDQRLDLVTLNERLLSGASNDYQFLFHDSKTLLLKSTDQLEILISNRILDYKEKERLKREKDRIHRGKKKQNEKEDGETISPIQHEPGHASPAPIAQHNKEEFITILKYIADGHNPFSGNRFSKNSLLNSIDFVRLLHKVIDELEKEI